MFQSARIRLTLWYLLIIMVVSICFSIVIYTGVNQEFSRFEQIEKRRQEEQKLGLPSVFQEFLKERQEKKLPLPKELRIRRMDFVDSQALQQSRLRIILILTGINGIILILSGFAGYFLAGRTLQPIQVMVDEQNRFITDASHELRTPLTALKSSIEVDLRDKNLTLAQAKAVLKSNLEEVNNLQLLTDNLMQLTQSSRGSQTLDEKVSLEKVIDEAIKKMKSLAQQKQITLTFNDKTTGIVLGEKQKLVELFVILLDNAIKYSDKNTHIKVSLQSKNGKVISTVTDEGIGIDPADLSKLFHRFYRASSSRSKSEVSGYGLGLSIAKHIVSVHNGTIEVDSNVGKGSTFIMTFPKA